MSTVPEVILVFRTAQHISRRELAERLSRELARRPYEPRSITHQAIFKWEHSQRRPDAAKLDFLAQNAQDPAIKQFASDLLAAITEAAPTAQ